MELRSTWRSGLRLLLLGVVVVGSVARPAAAQKSVAGMIGKDIEHTARDIWAVWTAPFDGSSRDYASALFLIGSAAAISPIDDDVDRWAVRNQNASALDFLEPFRKGGALYGGGRAVPAVAALYVAGIVTKKQGLRDAVTGCGATWASNHVFRRYVLYQLVGRERPDPTRGENPPPAAEPGDQYRFDVPNGGDWGWNSFPGGHIANIAGCASFFNNRYHLGFVEPVIYAIPVAIWLARTVDRAHWMSDNWLGAVMGYAIGREVAHRQLRREADRKAAIANGSVGAAPVPPGDGPYIARGPEGMQFGWQFRF